MASEDIATRLREAINIIEGSGLSVCTNVYTKCTQVTDTQKVSTLNRLNYRFSDLWK